MISCPNLDPSLIEDVAVGTVLSELGGSKAARMALNHVGYPSTTSLYTVNRACASSLQAITTIADSIALGRVSIGIGAGMESMTRNYGSKAIPTVLWPNLRNSPVKEARDCIMSMGLTSENVAERYGIDREDQDAFGAESHRKASRAQHAGLFDSEIIPVMTSNPPEDDCQEESDSATTAMAISKDDGIRHGASTETMAKLKPVFKDNGTSTAGNSSQVSDGAAAVLMMRRSTASALGLTSHIKAKWIHSVCVGVDPAEMGIGPAVAVPKLLEQAGVKKDEVGVWEINEAFASQALYCIRQLGLDMEKVNPRGGAIALGHPLGATGARMVTTIIREMEREGEVGVCTLCVGTGMGMAAMMVKE